MFSEEVKNLSRKIFATLIFITAIPDSSDRIVEAPKPPHAFNGESIHAVIDFRNDLYNHKGLPGGFSYEMVRHFAKDQNIPVRISVSRKSENYVDSIRNGSADILIRKLADSLRTTDLIGSVSADNYTYWAVRADKAVDMKEINIWLTMMKETKEYRDLRSRFYSQYDPERRLRTEYRSPRLSPYDAMFKKHAMHLGWDWRLLAAVTYQESKFAINTFSHRGAQGLMQVMPRTGAYYGITDLLDPEKNIEVGCKHLARLQRMFSGEEFPEEERVKFTLASYNAGEGRIADCRNLARLRGADDTKWDEVVTVIPEMRYPSILSEDSVKFGRFIGTETINYVSGIMDIYESFCEICP